MSNVPRRYTPDDLSPFLCIQPMKADDPRMWRLVTRYKIGKVGKFEPNGDGTFIMRESEGPQLACDIIASDVDSYERVASIEEAEDQYMSHAISAIRHKDDRRRYDYMTVFDLNVQSTALGQNCRRGNGWIAMMHPTMFNRIRMNPEDQRDNRETQWDFIPEDEQIRIGRWTLVATEDYRGINVWLSDHLPRNVTYCAYRGLHHEYNGGIKNQMVDGIVVSPRDGEFVLSPIGTSEEGIPLSHYISCWTHPEIEP